MISTLTELGHTKRRGFGGPLSILALIGYTAVASIAAGAFSPGAGLLVIATGLLAATIVDFVIWSEGQEDQPGRSRASPRPRRGPGPRGRRPAAAPTPHRPGRPLPASAAGLSGPESTTPDAAGEPRRRRHRWGPQPPGTERAARMIPAGTREASEGDPAQAKVPRSGALHPTRPRRPSCAAARHDASPDPLPGLPRKLTAHGVLRPGTTPRMPYPPAPTAPSKKLRPGVGVLPAARTSSLVLSGGLLQGGELPDVREGLHEVLDVRIRVKGKRA
jgi:hypothetical protein